MDAKLREVFDKEQNIQVALKCHYKECLVVEKKNY